MCKLGPAELIGTNSWGEVGLELLGLEPELEIVTVAGETRGVADRLTEGEARAERSPAGILPGRSGRPGDMFDLIPGEILFLNAGDMAALIGSPGEMLERGNPGEMLERGKPGETTATAALSLEAVLPLVAARLLLLLPPPGGGPVSAGADNSDRHFFTRFLARLASSLSEDFLLSSLMCLPSLVA